MSEFTMISPREAGIRREAIEQFLAQCSKKGLELHRLMILRRGKCCAKMTWAPYSEDDLHPLYSFSKSLTATAIGFARQEGLLRLDERIADIFPEDLPDEPSEHLLKCTIHHLLCMSCGQETESGNTGKDWRKAFFAHPFLHEPGTFYRYNTQGTNILAAIIRKRIGQQVTEYLRPRLFEPLGIGRVECAQLPDDLQTEIGGAGMKMTLTDMARFTQFMLQDGVWEGRELLKDWYMTRAGIKQMETAGDSEGHIEDWAMGYGYQCWMGKLEKSFRADGAFGQFGLVFPTLELCVIMNAATEQTQTLLDAVNDFLLPGVETASEDEGSDAEAEGNATCGGGQSDACADGDVNDSGAQSASCMNEDAICIEAQNDTCMERDALVRTLTLPALISCRNPRMEQELEGVIYRTEHPEHMAGIKRLVGGAGLFNVSDDEHISEIGFSFGEDELVLLMREDGREKELRCALDGRFATCEVDGVRYAGTARWRSLRKLELELRRLDAMSGVRLIICFEKNFLRMEADDTLMTDGGLGMVFRPLTIFSRK